MQAESAQAARLKRMQSALAQLESGQKRRVCRANAMSNQHLRQ